MIKFEETGNDLTEMTNIYVQFDEKKISSNDRAIYFQAIIFPFLFGLIYKILYFFISVGNKWIGYAPQFKDRPCDLKPGTRYKGVYPKKNSF